MDKDHFGTLEPDQLLGLTTAIETKDVETLGSEVLEVVASNLEVGDLASLDSTLASEILSQVSDEAIASFDEDRGGAALNALDADLLDAGGAGFESLSYATTIFDQVEFEAPEALTELMGEQGVTDFFGGNLFGES